MTIEMHAGKEKHNSDIPLNQEITPILLEGKERTEKKKKKML